MLYIGLRETNCHEIARLRAIFYYLALQVWYNEITERFGKVMKMDSRDNSGSYGYKEKGVISERAVGMILIVV
ncbi:MAG: hypothetical protein PWP75_1348 [Caldanaerobacter sp.]|jgi:hypothetical protein|uniref:Transposase n=1 Tax=Caldanaerobacter subterraneus TaxID=911092 RepID=A0A4V6NNY7_9THEO|nr:hypothetical protein [Caldanaerobacter sp.]TCO60220.1 hypothetical protein EV203_1224 [Caldanaerobacter subterraneus]